MKREEVGLVHVGARVGTDEEPTSWDGGALLRMHGHCRSEAPREACGVLLGVGDIICAIRPVTNIAKGNHHYELDHQELLSVHQECEEGPYDVLGYYHSHPEGPKHPSDLDREMALPGYLYVVVFGMGLTTFRKG